MKKFLSLVMALVMTMSLVTIGAGATEYKDFTDKGEVQYEEAVAVLNKLGIITGYEGGDFKPTGALTRGAAAKIIVSLMIGADAAGSLQVAAAPYKDVPVTNTFAAVISYCKTAGYINGYSDGTFRPTGALTGFAFAKMLLGALGYKGDIEGFSGSGWTMKVASVGSVAGLYDDFVTPFSGNAGVTREQACQLALNTLKATKVEYKGNDISVTGKDINVVVGTKDHTNVVNSSNTDGNIRMTNVKENGKDGLMQFAEQHFTDLKQLTDTTTDFGRPATRWSYKNVTIDEFAKMADFTFTAAPSGDTDKDKVKDMGLSDYKVYDGTKVTISDDSTGLTNYFGAAASTSSDLKAVKVSDVATKMVNLTGNGILVEVYVDDNNADIISDIVVVRTQLMEVNTVSSKTVTVKQLDEVGKISSEDGTGKDPVTGTAFNKALSSVKNDDDAFADLKDSKSGDYMLITYAKSDVYSAKAPQVVTGALTSVSRNNSNKVNGVTVGGTAYKLAAIRDDDFSKLDASLISATKKDVTLYLDAYGYATYIKDAGTSTNFMVYGDSYQTLVNGKLVATLTGWDLTGTEVSINVGNTTIGANGVVSGGLVYGDLIKYESADSDDTDYEVKTILDSGYTPGHEGYKLVSTANSIEAKDKTVSDGTNSYRIDSGIKTIFMDFNTNGTVKSIYVKNGLANITGDADVTPGSTSELAKKPTGSSMSAQMYINDDGAVEAVVVKTDSTDAVSDNVLYVQARRGETLVNGVRTYSYRVWVNGAEDDYTSTDKLDGGYFATYAEKADGSYKLSRVVKTDAATSAFQITLTKKSIDAVNDNLIYSVTAASTNPYNPDGTGVIVYLKTATGAAVPAGTIGAPYVLDTAGATWANTNVNYTFSSLGDIADSTDLNDNSEVTLAFVMNNKSNADDQYKISAIAVTNVVVNP